MFPYRKRRKMLVGGRERVKACVLEDVKRLEYKEVPTPAPKEGEVLLRIRACGICSSDIPRIFQTGTYHFPTIPGHEFSGEIVQAGPSADRALVGKRAVVFPLIPCGKCPSCQVGEYARCEHYDYFGSRRDGAFAEYLAVPVWNLVTFPESLPYTTAALCEPVSVAKHCADAGDIQLGDSVAVIGTGTIGLAAALWARLAGARQVILVGRSEDKLSFARSLGIDETVNTQQGGLARLLELTDGRGANVVLECVGSSESVCEAVSCAKKGGTVVLTGNPNGDITLPKQVYWKILRGELTVRGTWNSSYNASRNDWETALRYMADGRLPVAKLITHRFALRDHAQALDTVRARDVFSVKVMFEMGQESDL